MGVRKSRAKCLPATQAVELKPAKLEYFRNGGGTYPGFAFLRTWWEGDGPRAGIAERVLKKLSPGDDPDFGRALRYDVLLPSAAPSEYMDVEHLLARYDSTLPRYGRHAFAQVTITLDDTEPLHVAWERIRAYARSFTHRGLAVVLVLHAPSLALSSNAQHCHLIFPGRLLSSHGFGAAATALCSDSGHREAWELWQAHLATEGAAWFAREPA